MITLSKINPARLQKYHDLKFVFGSFNYCIRVNQLLMDIFAALQVTGPVYMREGMFFNYELNLTSIYVFQT